MRTEEEKANWGLKPEEDKGWEPPNFENVEEISRQMQERDTPSKKQARDKNLLRRSFEESKKMHGKRLYPYKLDFAEFFKDISDILKAKKPPADTSNRNRHWKNGEENLQ